MFERNNNSVQIDIANYKVVRVCRFGYYQTLWFIALVAMAARAETRDNADMTPLAAKKKKRK